VKFTTCETFCAAPVSISPELHENLSFYLKGRQVLSFHHSGEMFENQTAWSLKNNKANLKVHYILKTCYFLMPEAGNIA